MVGDEESLPKSGVLTSPNYPLPYPNNHQLIQTIEVAEGKTIHFSWTDFNTEPEYDYVQIVDYIGDGYHAEIGDQMSGYDLPPNFDSNSNKVDIMFHTDGNMQDGPWRLVWTEQ